jgi:hypothetical protein
MRSFLAVALLSLGLRFFETNQPAYQTKSKVQCLVSNVQSKVVQSSSSDCVAFKRHRKNWTLNRLSAWTLDIGRWTLDLESVDLIDGAGLRLLVWPPAQEFSPMTKSAASEVIILNFNDQLCLQWLPLG